LRGGADPGAPGLRGEGRGPGGRRLPGPGGLRGRPAAGRAMLAGMDTPATHIDDFIHVVPGALDAQACATIVSRMRESRELQPGRVGGGVYPELKHSSDLSLAGNAAWADVEQALNVAVYGGVLAYLRRWPQALVAPLMLQQPGPDGQLRRPAAGDFRSLR